MLKEAEVRLGVVLFHRHRTGVVPTAEAEPVLRRVRFLLGEMQGLTDDLPLTSLRAADKLCVVPDPITRYAGHRH